MSNVGCVGICLSSFWWICFWLANNWVGNCPSFPPISYVPVGQRLYDLSFLRKIENKESLVINFDRQKLDRIMTVGLGCLSDLYFLRKNRTGEVIGDCQNLDLPILMSKE